MLKRPWWLRWQKALTRPLSGGDPSHGLARWRSKCSVPNLEWLEHRLAPANTISIADGAVLEPSGNGTVNVAFQVTRTGDLSTQVTVGYTTVEGTAKANTD